MVVTGADEKFFGIPHLSHARRKKFNGPGHLLKQQEYLKVDCGTTNGLTIWRPYWHNEPRAWTG